MLGRHLIIAFILAAGGAIALPTANVSACITPQKRHSWYVEISSTYNPKVGVSSDIEYHRHSGTTWPIPTKKPT